MPIFYVKALFKCEGIEQSKSGYVMAETIADAMSWAGDRIRTYGLRIDIHHMECSRRQEQLMAEECYAQQPVEHWDKLFSNR